MGRAPCEYSQRCTRARARGGQAISASRQQNSGRHEQPVGHCFQPVRGFAWACMAQRARNTSPWLLANFRDFETPDHVPRISARAPTCAVVFRRAPCVPRSREHEERPAAGRAKNADAKKNTLTHGNTRGLRRGGLTTGGLTTAFGSTHARNGARCRKIEPISATVLPGCA